MNRDEMKRTEGRRARRGGFTLIELLVVVSIIALLSGILLPALGAAQGAARQVVCQSNIRSILQLQIIYGNDWRDHYSSPVNVGTPYIGQALTEDGFQRGSDALLGTTTPDTPVSTQDWLSPLLGNNVDLHPNRARRHANLFNDYGCVAALVPYDEIYPFNSGGANDRIDFEAVIGDTEILQASYLMPTGFAHLRNSDANREFLEQLATPLRNVVRPFPSNVNSMMSHSNSPQQPRSFKPLFTRVGTVPSDKVMFADATRYWTGEILDFDISPAPSIYGSFTSSTPQFIGSTAWGEEGNDPGGQGQIELTFRHPGDSTNTAYFDGHVGSMSKEEVWGDPNPWHPTGTEWVTGSHTPESNALMAQQDNIID